MKSLLRKIKAKKKGKRIGFLLLLGCILSISTAVAQSADADKKISFQCNNEKLSVALQQVERLSDYYKIQFAYDDVENYKVTVHLKNVSVASAVSELLRKTKLQFEINGRFVQIFSAKSSQANKGTIRGTIKDKNGNPLECAVVQNKTDNNGVIADINGKFILDVSHKNVMLTISYIGKKPLNVKADNGTIVSYTLEDDDNMINDVVVTGYQNINRRQLTSAVSSVKMDDIRVPGISNLAQMLEGKVPDMVVSTNSGEINATPRLRIRGTSTIIGNREPLWVVDGIIVNDPVNLSADVLNDPDYVNRIGNAISGLNPQDIERLDVLKDASATALYGTRAANGVIVITTKKGRIGKPVISYSATTSFRRRPHYTDKRVNLMNSQERIGFSQDLVANHYAFPTGMPMVGYEAALQNYYSGISSEQQFRSTVAQLQTMNTDWFELLTHNSFSHDHSVSISGGSETVRYYTSIGYTNEEDVLNNTTNHRYTAMSKLDMTLSPKFQLSFNLNGYLNEREYAQSTLNAIDYAYNTSRAIPAFQTDGTYAYYKKSSYNGYLNYNFLNELENSSQLQNTNSFTATANLRYFANDWLNVNAIFSGTLDNAKIEGYWGEKTFYASDLRRAEYGETPPSNSLLPYGGELSTQNTQNKSYTARLQANINKYLGEEGQHNLNISLGAEANSNRYESNQFTQRGYYPDRGKSFISDISPVDFANYYQGFVMSNVPLMQDNRTHLLSAYATASYSYKDYFTLNANTRYDGSNKFGSRSNEKLLPVWSVSGMADLKNITAINADWIDNLILKTSYGEQGNMLDGQYPELVIKKGSHSSYYDELTSTTQAFANPDLKWEKTRSVNIGVEGSFFNGRLTLGAEYYHKKTTDAFMEKSISDVNGYTSYMVNSGTLINKGYNLNLTAVPVKTNDFNWIFSASISKAINLMKTAPGKETYNLEDFLNGTAVVEEQPLGTFYSYKYLGLSPVDGGPLFDDWEDRQTELIGLNKYDTYTQVLKATGKRDPDITGSVNTTFNYKSWRLGIMLNYSLGANTRLFRMLKNATTGYSPEMNINRDMLNAWKKPGDELITNVPSIMSITSEGYFYYNSHWSSGDLYSGSKIADNAWDMYDYSDLRVVSADYLKIANISLTYELPKRILNHWGLGRLAITLSGNNLHTFCHSELKGQTPTQGGFSEVQLSDTPTYTLGLTLDF